MLLQSGAVGGSQPSDGLPCVATVPCLAHHAACCCRGDKYHDSGLVPYGTSKAMLIMFSWELQRRLAGTGVDVFMAHPGG